MKSIGKSFILFTHCLPSDWSRLVVTKWLFGKWNVFFMWSFFVLCLIWQETLFCLCVNIKLHSYLVCAFPYIQTAYTLRWVPSCHFFVVVVRHLSIRLFSPFVSTCFVYLTHLMVFMRQWSGFVSVRPHIAVHCWHIHVYWLRV